MPTYDEHGGKPMALRRRRHVIRSFAFTLSRLCLAPALMVSFIEKLNPACVVSLITVAVVSDIADGMYARLANAETTARRIADVVVDKIIIHVALGAAIATQPKYFALYVPLACRDALVAVGYLAGIVAFRTVITGGSLHRITSLACAAFAVSLLTPSQTAVAATAFLSISVALCCAVDFLGAQASLYQTRVKAVQPKLRLQRVDRFAGFHFLAAGLSVPLGAISPTVELRRL